MKRQTIGQMAVWMCCALAYSIGSFSLNAQTFEFTYGSPQCLEAGFRGVEPVDESICCGGGFIAVGVSNNNDPATSCGDADAYVVRANPDGTHLWERTYDIGRRGWLDTATSIKEVSDGFIICGYTRAIPLGSISEIFLLKIDCSGNPIWSKTYAQPNVNAVARDIIVATKGNGISTKTGDFVIAGSTSDPGTQITRALLMRVQKNGTLIWNTSYSSMGNDPDPERNDDYFSALTEAKVTGVGDIIAVGGTNRWMTVIGNPTPLWNQGLVIRVNGNTGMIGMIPQGMGHYGSFNNEGFTDVEELNIGSEAGNLILVGNSATGMAPTMMYLVKTSANPCNQLAQQTFNSPNNFRIAAMDILEIHTPGMPFGSVGDLALVGYTYQNCFVPSDCPTEGTEDAFLLRIDPALFASNGIVFRQQSICNWYDAATSVHEIRGTRPGFIIGGFTSFTQGAVICPGGQPTPDPQDLLLIRTNSQGHTNKDVCSKDWFVFQEDPQWNSNCGMVNIMFPLSSQAISTTSIERNWPTMHCETPDEAYDGDPPPNSFNNSGADEVQEQNANSSVRFYPNPVKQGENIALDLTGMGTGNAEITVVDATGKNIGQLHDVPNNQPAISTQGWSAGVYIITVERGGTRESIRVIVE